MNNDKSWRDEFDIIEVDHWEVPDKNDARILTQPNIVYPLHSLAPRTVLGVTAWNHIRKATYAAANNVCEICGGDHRINAHELYDIDYAKQEATFVRTICVDQQCVDEDTEVLTESGWKKIPTVTTKDKVACFNAGDESIIFDNPTKTIVQKHDKAIKITGNGAELYFSDMHRMPLRVKSTRSSKNNTIVDVLAKDYLPSHYYNWVLSGNNRKKGHLTDAERVFIAIEADGYMAHDKESVNNGKRTRAYNSRFGSEDYRYTYHINLLKTRKIERFKELLRNSGLKYNITKETSDNYCEFNVWSNKELKHFSNCFDINMGSEKALEFIEELIFWDGTFSGKATTWFTNKPEEVSFVQAVAAQCSIRTKVNIVNRIGNLRKGRWNTPYERLTYSVCFESVNTEFTGRTMVPETIKWGKNMYCITVPTSYFVAKRGNLVFVTGNCHQYGIHTGRALTLYKQGNPLYTKERLLEGAEHCFTIISSWNREHPEEEPLRVFSAWLDYLKQPDLEKPMRELIKKYDIKFYKVSEKWWNRKRWSNWKLRIGNKWYNTPYADRQAWEKAMAAKAKDPHDDHGKKSNLSGGVFDEIDKFLKENAE